MSVFTLLGKAKKAKKSCSKAEGKENVSKEDKEIAISAQHDGLVITQILESSTSSDPVPAHPHFGGKQPKHHKPPKYISVLCREEKDALTDKLEDVTKIPRQGLRGYKKNLVSAIIWWLHYYSENFALINWHSF